MDEQLNTESLNVSSDAVPIPATVQTPQLPKDEPSPPIRPARRKDKINKTLQTNGMPILDRKDKIIPALPSGNVINIINSQGIHWGPEVVYNFGSKPITSTKDKNETVEKSDDILALMESKDQITHEYMDIVSKQLGEGWRSVFRKMGYEDGLIEITYESNHHKGISEVIYQMLLDWIRVDDRTLGDLCTVLWNEERFTLVQNLSVLFNTLAKEQSKCI